MISSPFLGLPLARGRGRCWGSLTGLLFLFSLPLGLAPGFKEEANVDFLRIEAV